MKAQYLFPQFPNTEGALRSFSLSGTLRCAPLETYTSALRFVAVA